MALKLLEEGKINPEEKIEIELDQEDFNWWCDHSKELEEKYLGKYVSIINKEVFAGDTYEEAESKAKSKYPNRQPFIEYVPYK